MCVFNGFSSVLCQAFGRSVLCLPKAVFLIHSRLDNQFPVLLARSDTGLVSVFGEEDSEMACRYSEFCRSLVAVELYVLTLVVLLRHVLAIDLRFPSHHLVAAQRILDIQIVAVCLHAAFGLLFALEIIDIHKEVLAVQKDLARRHLFQVVFVVEFHELFEARYAIEVPIGVL